MEGIDSDDIGSEPSAIDGEPSGDQPLTARIIIDADEPAPASLRDRIRNFGNFGGTGRGSSGDGGNVGGTSTSNSGRTRKPRAAKAEAFALGTPTESESESVNVGADVRRNVRQIFKGISKKWGPHWQLEKDEIELICIPLTKLLKTTIASNVASSPKMLIMLTGASVALVSFPKIVVSMQHAKQMQAVTDAIARGAPVVNFQGNLNGFGTPPPPQTGNPVDMDMDGIDPNPVMTPKDELRGLIAQVG